MQTLNRYAVLAMVVSFFLSAFSGATAAQGTNTTTTTVSTSVGAGSMNAVFVWTSATVGAIGGTTIPIGNQGTCTIPPGPYPNANCSLFGGTGAVADPFQFVCSSPLTLSACSLPGTPFFVPAGGVDFDTHTHAQAAAGALPAAVPLGPWVPVGSALAVMALALAWRRRASRA
jgi:hypothetical protein